MSNRSKKNIFDKEPNDTLKKVLVSPGVQESHDGTRHRN